METQDQLYQISYSSNDSPSVCKPSSTISILPYTRGVMLETIFITSYKRRKKKSESRKNKRLEIDIGRFPFATMMTKYNITTAITTRFTPIEEPRLTSLSMGTAILTFNSETGIGTEYNKSSVEDLVPIPSESEGIPDKMCDVPLCENTTPLNALNEHSEIVVNSDDDNSSSERFIPLVDISSMSMHPSPPILRSSLRVFPPADRSDFNHEEFADELTHIVSLPELECFKFKIEVDPGDLTSIDLGIRKNVSTTNVMISRFVKTLKYPQEDHDPASASFGIPHPKSNSKNAGDAVRNNPDAVSRSYRLNPIYAIKECSSCGSLYTSNCGCSKGSLKDKILVPKPPRNCVRCAKCGTPVDGPYCQGCALLRKEFMEGLLTNCVENEFFKDFQDTSESSDDNTNVVNAPREPIVVNQDPGENSSPSPPHIDHCCHECGDSLDGIFCRQCTCKSCGKGAHYVIIAPHESSDYL
ncbi:hypothetical protein Tco_1112779 [Tanacetum coccineum]|uniref:Uncharacterized protein n=1 Tax=Tanacetum coccineum TaxID=301880 RepID=A0ABQ5IQA4_9ASTR